MTQRVSKVRTLHFVSFMVLSLVGCGEGTSQSVIITVTHSRIPGADAGLEHAANVSDAPAVDGMSCNSPSVSNIDRNHVTGLAADSCGSPDAPACPSGRVTFSCPTVSGPGDAGTIHPGDAIRIDFQATSDGKLNYPCWGLVADHGVIGSTDITYAVPTEWGLSAKVPASLSPGTTVHFILHVVSNSPLNTSSCTGNRGRLDFDVRVD